ncbi:MAG TPA: allantoinase AllB [Anaerolineales bacterium]|nr:allantoinase AllB [Anaerolineales bacterium]
MSADLYLRNARVVTEDEDFLGGVIVEGEKVLEVVNGAPQIEAQEVVDLEGLILVPGVIDGHVHFNEPGREHWEGYRTGTMAAAAGGTTTIFDMPLNSTPPTTNLEMLKKKREVVASEAVVDYGQWGGYVGSNLDDLPALNDAGVVAFKGFMSNSGVDYDRLNDDVLYAGLLKMAEMGNILGVHAENEWVTSYLSKVLKGQGRIDRAAWYESRPPATELEAVQRASFWAGVTGGNLHIVHVSIADGHRAIAKAKQEGAHVTSETCPHYLFFDHQEYEKIGPAAKCAPPIRSREDVEDLWQCVLDGLVDVIGSDHSPCSWDEKEKGLENIWKAWGGVSGVQMLLTVMISEGYHRRGLPLTSIARLLSSNPARLYGVGDKKGSIRPGLDADFAVIDPNEIWTLTEDLLYNKNKFSAYTGYEYKGRVKQTYVRGKLVYKEGQVIAKPGYGRLVTRTSQITYA